MRDRDAIGFVIALPLECRSLTCQPAKRLETLDLGPNDWIRVSGAGAANAEAAANALVARGARRLVSWGCAGALADHLAPGDVVLAESVSTTDGAHTRFCDEWRDRLAQSLAGKVRTDAGSIADSLDIVDTAAAKRRLNQSTGSVAVDMESAAVLRVAEQRDIPCIAVRAIADNASTSVPRTVLRSLDQNGEVQLARLLLELARRPSEVFALLHLNRCFRAAIQSLTKVADITGRSLAA